MKREARVKFDAGKTDVEKILGDLKKITRDRSITVKG
jgi:hypothetical protein